MVAGFNRSFSLPGSKPATHKSYHTRSISLPCRSHPLISHLEDDIRSIKSWQSSKPESASTSWICDGLARLELLHTSVNDLLNQDSLRLESASEWTSRVLDDFLRFADAYGRFRSEIMAMNDHQSDAQLAVRSKDDVKLTSCSRSIKKAEKELVKLASSLRDIAKSPIATRFTSRVEEAELGGIIREVIEVTASASTDVFFGVAAVSSTVSTAKNSWTSLRRLSSTSRSFKSVGEESEMERLERVEECVRKVERGSERLFRCLVNTRVSLLNILTCY